MGAGLPSILRWLLWLLRPLWRPRNWGQFGPSFGPDSSFAKTGFSPSDGKGEHSCTQK